MNKARSGMSGLAFEAGFGTRIWSYPGYLAAKYFHALIGLFVIFILYFSIAAYVPFPFNLLPVVVYLAYFVARHLIPARLEPRFYRPWPQVLRAQAGMVALFLLSLALERLAHARTDVWLLYLLPLLIISRHSTTPIFNLSVGEACLMVAAARWNAGLPAALAAGDWLFFYDPGLIVQCLELMLVAFVVHYLMHNIDARDDIIAGFEAIESLSAQANQQAGALLPADRWQLVLGTYLRIVKGVCGGIWLCDHNTRRIRPIPDLRYCLGQKCPVKAARCDAEPLDMAAAHPIAEAVRSGRPIFCQSEAARRENQLIFHSKSTATCPLPEGISTRIVVPIAGPEAGRERTLGALCIDFERHAVPHEHLLGDYFAFLSGLARRVRPILFHMQQLEELRSLQHIGQRISSSLALDEVLDDALDAVVGTLGFEFATISLVDPEEETIHTVAGRNVPPEWVQASVHSLHSADIQADIVRHGRQEVLSGWDDRFDRQIWQTFHHEDMIRVFTPIAGADQEGEPRVLGTIEAGYYTATRDQITEEQRRMLDIFARRMAAALENALLFERTQRRAESLASLHRLGWEVALNRDLAEALDSVGHTVRAVLDADLVMLYRYNRQAQILEYPRIFGTVVDLDRYPLRLPSPDEGFIATILASRQAFYAADAQFNPRLVGAEAADAGAPAERRHTFTERQGIVSFAGAPLIADDTAVGVLCVNYRKRHTFPEDERQVLEIAAQFAAAALRNAETSEMAEELIAGRERVQLAAQLHHSLSQYLPAIRLMAETAGAHLDDAADQVADRLKKIEAAATRAMTEVRVNIFELNAKGPLQGDLRQVLEDQAREARAYFGLEVDLRVDLGGGLRMPIARELLMVCREAIANTAKHASATRLTLDLRAEAQAVYLVIQDDGCGFEPARVAGRHGLAMMQERVEKLAGQLQIESQPGAGTVIRAQIPVS